MRQEPTLGQQMQLAPGAYLPPNGGYSVYFRSTYIVRHFGLRPTPETLVLENSAPPPIKLSVRPIKEEELKQLYEKDDWVATVTTEEGISENVASHFDLDEGNATEVRTDVAKRVSERMRTFLNEFLQLVRWRIGIYGHHEVIRCATEGLLWSRDEVAWQPFNRRITVSAGSYVVAKQYDARRFDQIRQMMLAEEYEPIGHELLREAWNLARHSRRSALMLGMSALEVGLKGFISKLVPNSEWLCLELPNPPVDKMLRKYIPLLPAKLMINGRVFIPDRILKCFKDAIETRNRVAHRGESVLNDVSLGRILANIQSTLYLLDYYSGHAWALDNIRDSDLHDDLKKGGQ